MKTIVIIGSGARECAVLMKLVQSNDFNNYNVITISTFKNPYMFIKSDYILVDDFSYKSLTQLEIFKSIKLEEVIYEQTYTPPECENTHHNIEYVFIGPENPIRDGFADFLNERDIHCIAPTKEHAMIESSKGFARKLLTKNNLAKYNPRYNIIKKGEVDKLRLELDKNYKKVIKKNGLCGGKGVFVEDEHFDNSNIGLLIPHFKSYLNTDDIVIEEKLEGLEFSLMSFVDKNGHLLHLPPVFDYKRAGDNDTGPNTGSMGSVILNTKCLYKFIPKQYILEAELINTTVINILNKTTIKNDTKPTGSSYIGILYGSYMLCTNNKLKVIEYNCRFGDPEGVLTLYSFTNDLNTLFKSMIYGTLNKIKLDKIDTNVVGVYVVPTLYPLHSSDIYDIYFQNTIKKINAINLNKYIDMFKEPLSLIYGDCELTSSHFYTKSSRTMLVVGQNKMLYKATNYVYNNIDDIVSKVKYRSDIGGKFLSKYENAGVSINNANDSIGSIKNMLLSTYNKNVESSHGDFGGCYNLNGHKLVSSIDGVGTKTHFIDKYFTSKDYESLGVDIVNHNINDILVMGALPLFFLDYFGAAELDRDKLHYFIKGATKALTNINYEMNYNTDSNTVTSNLTPFNVPLIGGETAEMPTTYKQNANDIVGCMVGEINQNFIQFPRKPKSGDIIIGFSSDGPHTNGFSLINSIDWSEKLLKYNLDTNQYFNFIKTLKKPRKSYLPIVKNWIFRYGIKSIIKMCHVTGGGLLENLVRVLPKDSKVILNYDMIDTLYPSWCKIIENTCSITNSEMYRVFNCGIGFVLVVDPMIYNIIQHDKNLKAHNIGHIY